MDGPWQEHKENVKNLQADLNVESSEAVPSLSEDAGTDITHVEKRHKVDHESSGSLFQVRTRSTQGKLVDYFCFIRTHGYSSQSSHSNFSVKTAKAGVSSTFAVSY